MRAKERSYNKIRCSLFSSFLFFLKEFYIWMFIPFHPQTSRVESSLSQSNFEAFSAPGDVELLDVRFHVM